MRRANNSRDVLGTTRQNYIDLGGNATEEIVLVNGLLEVLVMLLLQSCIN